ncbi:MAG TPA: winged helix-turn-helix domain-containing protein [Solirubrobacteraceae bacterium]|nr:winged helix-turn-helix domain-containing protein [Solirubrobacteraceae bacterium]
MNAQIVDIDDPRLVKALAHPVRMKILNILDDRTATPKELAQTLGMPLENVSYHVRTLKDFGFIKLERTRQVRGAVEHHYKVAARPRIGDKLWAETPRVVQEALVDAHLEATVDLVGQSALQGGFDFPQAHIARHSLALDEAGLEEASKILSDAYDKLEAISEKCRKRSGADVRRISTAVLMFETPEALPPEEATQKRDTARRRRAQKSTA